MMKVFASICLLVVLVAVNQAQAESLVCNVRTNAIFKAWPDMKTPCVNSMRKQIQKEIHASVQYLAMAAHFSTDTVNRPGFAEHFFKAAKEEREHGSKLVEYLSMRGELTDTVKNLIQVPTVKTANWSGIAALEDAFKLETEVTKSIRDLIKTCEGTGKDDNDYHLVDYLTGVYLEEQLHGQRELAGQITTLEKMMSTHGELGEFLFDKNM
ncbi:ferritin subunit isoform X2 [Drosophila busckii]|uniref:ferritin subunit isoform X2 n=1 Tax=Drosophila busckii TaxID=30019 RepID=UPI00083F23A1|nr:ferritin subunit isoform X2 [Drosophila busckii]